jgi:hypothetical protein
MFSWVKMGSDFGFSIGLSVGYESHLVLNRVLVGVGSTVEPRQSEHLLSMGTLHEMKQGLRHHP